MFKNVAKEEITIPAQMSQLNRVRDFIEQIGKKYKFSHKIVNSFKLVVDEACTNIIRHGYQDIEEGQITIRAIVRRMSLTMVIIDQGRSFDPRQVKNPDLNKYIQIGKKGGLGIFMMRKLMDDIKYNITENGNELRLTKVREDQVQPKLLEWWDSLTLRTKFFLVTSLAVTLIAVGIFSFLFSKVSQDVRQRVFSESAALTKNFAELCWEALDEDQDLVLFQTAKSIKDSRPHLIAQTMVLDSQFTVKALYPIVYEKLNSRMAVTDLPVARVLDQVRVLKNTRPDSVAYFVMSPVQLTEVDPAPLGYALVSIHRQFIQGEIQRTQRRLMLGLILFLVLAYGGIFVLVRLITEPFHKLAEWVRQVGRGTVDEDEIDFDSRDELGEIAQAFNEMTTKFREVQYNLIEQQRLQKELQVAQEIQQMLLPDDFPDVVGYDIASYYQAAKEVGGDLFDFVEVDENSIGICVADVSGKGVPGSLVMTMIRTALRLEARGNKNPAEVLTRVNAFVTDDIRRGMFVTMFYVILDSRERMVSFASAGHNPMILYRAKTQETFYLNPSGFPVGITLPDIRLFAERIQADRIRLHPDDILVLYTDGITEAMNPKRELYGEERFLAAIRKYGHLDVVEFVKQVKEDILDFTGGFEQNDDITLVAIKENMTAVDVKVQMFKDLFESVRADNGKTVAQACRTAGISPTTYYRYKKIYEAGGYEYLREMLHGYTNLSAKHLSIEVKTKIYDIIQKHPEYGAKRISNILNTEAYGFTKVSPRLIYEELKRAKLNTKERRIQFVKRGGKRRLKPPGTPLLTLDGEVMVGYRTETGEAMTFPQVPRSFGGPRSKSKEKLIAVRARQEAEPSEASQILNEIDQVAGAGADLTEPTGSDGANENSVEEEKSES
ncbi:MAG: HAMP domain-containing protein [Calditrichaeota bacterium]|nr:MAG: HAMP domain-containing protein [Calditrichota bacterium]